MTKKFKDMAFLCIQTLLTVGATQIATKAVECYYESYNRRKKAKENEVEEVMVTIKGIDYYLKAEKDGN